MSLRRAIAEHTPHLKHLIGVIPADELAERALDESAEKIAEEMFTEDEHAASMDRASDDGRREGREEVKEEVLDVLDNSEWETGDELAKLVRAALA